MSTTASGEWYWCLRHDRVEPRTGCANDSRLGPYPTEAEAARALQKVAERNETWDAEDERWEAERP